LKKSLQGQKKVRLRPTSKNPGTMPYIHLETNNHECASDVVTETDRKKAKKKPTAQRKTILCQRKGEGARGEKWTKRGEQD